jgi:hypothetical protein
MRENINARVMTDNDSDMLWWHSFGIVYVSRIIS